MDTLDLSPNEWHEIRILFKGEQVTISLEGNLWKQTLKRPGFSGPKRKLLWMQNGGEARIELDDIKVHTNNEI